MTPDLFLAIGTIFVLFSIPSIVSAWSEGDFPRTPVLALLLGIAMVVYACVQVGWSYTLMDIPMVFLRLAALFIH